MAEQDTLPRNTVQSTEAQFYARYDWCLNPLLSLRDLFRRLREELTQYDSLRLNWQREESRINLYLFVCAIACSVDDYFVWRRWEVSSLADRFPKWKPILQLANRLLNLSTSIPKAIAHRDVIEWRQKWTSCVEQVCGILAMDSEPDESDMSTLRQTSLALTNMPLPADLLRRRMTLNEGFRCQDLTHHDVHSMVRHFLGVGVDRSLPILVIGPRTAGSYFAPLVKAHLSSCGWANVSWITIRPIFGLSQEEKRRLKQLLTADTHVLIIDDYPNTGRTLKMVHRIATSYGIRPGSITIIAPQHPAQPNWVKTTITSMGARILALPNRELYKEKVMNPQQAESLLREYYQHWGWDEVSINETPEIDRLNSRLQSHYADGFQVRLKRVYEVRLTRNGQEPVTRHVLAKSVGWGWLGYHAYIAAARLTDYVPKLVGLREGVLFTEWLSEVRENIPSLRDGFLARLASYISARTQRLGLREDPRFGNPSYGWGWLEILGILRRPFGVFSGRLKDQALLRQLRDSIQLQPTLIDGHMRPQEWIETGQGTYKVDFEQHNFGPPELDVVDPAYDLAAATFEFCLSDQSERALLHEYIRKSGDGTVADRMLLYKLLYGTVAMRRATEGIRQRGPYLRQEELNQRYISARDFLLHSMNQFSASLIHNSPPSHWTSKLFFLDLDGVFDCEILGFPHTTVSGLRALASLKSGGYSVVLNTGRSVDHVRSYCRTYALQGGVAEYGSVFVDNTNQKEIPFVTPETLEQLSHCRELLKRTSGVFVDPDYRYSIRAYRYSGNRTMGLSMREVEEILRSYRYTMLKCIFREEDTYVVQKGTGKGPALHLVKHHLGFDSEPVVAIGDSDEDIGMLQAAEISYAPLNCSPEIRRLDRASKCRIMRRARQKGLFAAVRDVLHLPSPAENDALIEPDASKSVSRLLLKLMEVADQPRWRRLFVSLDTHEHSFSPNW